MRIMASDLSWIQVAIGMILGSSQDWKEAPLVVVGYQGCIAGLPTKGGNTMRKQDDTTRLVRSQTAVIRMLMWQLEEQDRARIAAEEEVLSLRNEVHLLKCYEAIRLLEAMGNDIRSHVTE